MNGVMVGVVGGRKKNPFFLQGIMLTFGPEFPSDCPVRALGRCLFISCCVSGRGSGFCTVPTSFRPLTPLCGGAVGWGGGGGVRAETCVF